MANRTKTTTIKRKPLKTLCINVCHIVAFCPSWILRLNIQFVCAVHGFWDIRMCGERAHIGVRQLASSAFTAMRHRIPNGNAIEKDWIYKKKSRRNGWNTCASDTEHTNNKHHKHTHSKEMTQAVVMTCDISERLNSLIYTHKQSTNSNLFLDAKVFVPIS